MFQFIRIFSVHLGLHGSALFAFNLICCKAEMKITSFLTEYTEMVGNLQEAFQMAVERYLESDPSSDEEVAVEFPTGASSESRTETQGHRHKHHHRARRKKEKSRQSSHINR
jgi:hypothetical protein